MTILRDWVDRPHMPTDRHHFAAHREACKDTK